MSKKEQNMMKDVRKVVDRYFDGVEHEVRMKTAGNCIVVSVSYQDFKPASRVRYELEGLSPLIVVQTLDRRYSDYATQNAIELMADLWLQNRSIEKGMPDMPEFE